MRKEVKLQDVLRNTINYHKHGTMQFSGTGIQIRWEIKLHLKQRNSRKHTKHLCIDWDWVTPHWAQWGKPGKTWRRGKSWPVVSICFQCFSCLILEITLHLHPKCQIWHKSTVATWPEGSERVLCKLICLVCMLWSNETWIFLLALVLRLEGWQYWRVYSALDIEIEIWITW